MGPPPNCYILVAVLAVVGVISKGVQAELTPPYFNLAEGRKISATATCGKLIINPLRIYSTFYFYPNSGVDTDGPELFCKLVGANTENEAHEVYSLLRGQVSGFIVEK